MASDVARCEPPEEHRSERWHTLRYGTHADSPQQWLDGRWWGDWHSAWTPEDAAARGYRYLAPALPPEPKGEG